MVGLVDGGEDHCPDDEGPVSVRGGHQTQLIQLRMDMCDILSWTTMWAVLAVWEIMKMALMVIARYNFLFTRPR